jgi:TonB family protein
LVYIRRGTTQEEFQTSYLGWLEKVRRWMEDETYNPLRNQKTIDGSYPEAACRRTMPATSAVIGVGVDADGKVVTDVELVVLRSSGFQVFNEQAIEDAKAAEFEATGKPEAYYVIVNYPEHSAEVCPSQPAEGEPPPSAAPSTPTG